MRIIGVLAVAVGAVVALTGCAREPDGVAQMGCQTADTFLPELDAAMDGEAPTEDLSDRLSEEIELGWFDEEGLSLFRLLAEDVRDQFGAGYTPVDVDMTDIRARLVAHCESVDWPLENA